MGNTSRTASKRAAGKKSEEWKFPVSRKYYEKLKEKVVRIYLDLGHYASWSELVMKWIDIYLLTGEKPDHRYADEHVMCIFFALKQEIDEAVRRSALARQRAAERRARKQAEKAEYVEKAENIEKVETAVQIDSKVTDYDTVIFHPEPRDCIEKVVSF